MRRPSRTPFALAALIVASSACGRGGMLPAGSSTPTPVQSGTPTPTPTGTPGAPPSVADPRESNISYYDAAASDLAGLTDPAARQSRVDQLFADLDAHGGLPARGSGRLVFLFKTPNDDWNVAGSFNNWDTGANPLTRISGTDTVMADVSVAADSRVSYKFVEAGTNWSRDPLARWVEWDGINTGTIGNFNSVAFAGAGAALNASELYLFVAHATALANDREVYVQVPASYFPARGMLPLLVMHDGNESICRGQFHLILDDARTQGTIPTFLVAYVALHDQAERMDEYTFGTTGARGLDYEAFIADELVPMVESRFATPRSKDARAIIGASLGGLISYRIGYDRPDVFSRVGGQSSSFFWNNDQMITDIQNGPARPGFWYLDAGEDADNGTEAALMKAALDAKGYDEDYVRDLNAQHDWSFWGPRLPGALAFLFGS